MRREGSPVTENYQSEKGRESCAGNYKSEEGREACDWKLPEWEGKRVL